MPRIKSFFSNLSLYKKILIFSIMLVSLPVIILTMTFYHTYNETTTEQVSNSIKANLNQTSYAVDSILQNMLKTANELKNQADISNYINIPYQNTFLDAYEVLNIINSYKDTNELIHSVYIYSRMHSNYLTTMGYYKESDFFDPLIQQKMNDPYTASFISATHPIIIYDVLNSIPEHIISIGLNETDLENRINGSVVVNISENELFNYVKTIQLHDFDEVMILNQQGQIVSHSNKEMLYSDIDNESYIQQIMSTQESEGNFYRTIDENQVLVSYVTGKNGWKYVSAARYDQIIKQSKKVTSIILWISLTVLVLGTLLSIFASRNVYRPFGRLVQNIENLLGNKDQSSEERPKNEIDFIQSRFTEISNQTDELQSTLKSNFPILRERFLDHLVAGEAWNAEEFKQEVSFLDLQLTETQFVVLTIKINNFEEFYKKYSQRDLSLYKFGISNIAKEISNNYCNGLVFEHDRNTVVVLLNFHEPLNIEDMKKQSMIIAEEIQKYTHQFVKYPITVGIGEPVTYFHEIKKSFEQAKDALEYTLSFGINLVIPAWKVGLAEKNYYSFQKEKHLLQLLKSGNIDQVDEILMQIQGEIRNLSHEQMERTLMMLFNAIFRTVYEIDMIFGESDTDEVSLLHDFRSLETLEQRIDFLYQLCLKIHQSVAKKQSSKSNELVDKILQYINENLGSNISLEMAADAVNISPSYLAKIFKEHTGTTFLEYVTKQRMDKAAELLTSNKTIKVRDIYEELGFSSQQYFTQVFKKHFGVTPNQYRR